MLKSFLALSVVALLTVGCTVAPVRYVPVYYQAQKQSLVLPQAPMPAGSQQSQQIVVPVTPAPGVVYIQQPLMYYNPIADIAVGYMVWRAMGGWHGGHHRR